MTDKGIKFAKIAAFTVMQLLMLMGAYLAGLLVSGSVLTPVVCVWLKIAGEIPAVVTGKALEIYLIASVIPCVILYTVILARGIEQVKEGKEKIELPE